MNCEPMLARMLDAEPAELLGRGGAPLAAHIRSCARCRGVAARIAADTMALAAAIRDPALVARQRDAGRRPGGHGRLIAAGALAAAALLAAAVWMSAPESSSAPVSVLGAAPAAAGIARAPGAVVAPAATNTHSARRTAPTTPILTAQRFPAQPPVQPERLAGNAVASPREPSTPLAVRPPPGVRAAVLQTANPTITVVWLY